MGEFSDLSPAPLLQTPPTRSLPFREDCWSEEATSTLVDAWGRRYLELNRGNLRQKDWQEVADAVNARHGHTKKTRRTDVQCKNRIDTLKKKYKIEKAKISESNGTLTSSWPFFARLDALIGNNLKNQQQKTSPMVNSLSSHSPLSLPSPPMGIPLINMKLPQLLPPATSAAVEPVVLPQKRQFSAVDDSYFRKNYSAVAAAAAAAAEEVEDDEEEDGGSEEDEDEEVEREEGTVAGEEGVRRLAKAIERFGEIYERVENMKQRQMVELEKQRMQFAKDLEVQRMQLFMDTQVQLEKIKQSKRSGSDDLYS
ncbi:trihelix transcription factor ASIL2-like [Coffea eugenioides]|uniref:trihelix transcription factor ASIL2-like n=1 Tax=Coffea eugenioides TaxID=49369 RepID=UPI000F61339B|nr:trihelix transcription factor ASIL2-like [Coffea eugenioides]